MTLFTVPASRKARKGVYSPSKRAGWTSDVIQISLTVRAWYMGKITSLSLNCPRYRRTQHPRSIAQRFPCLQAVTPTDSVRLGEGAEGMMGVGAPCPVCSLTQSPPEPGWIQHVLCANHYSRYLKYRTVLAFVELTF